MTSGKQILDDLYQLMKTLPQNPIAKSDEVNTTIHIYAVKEEIKKATEEKYIQDCQEVLVELVRPRLREMNWRYIIEN